MPLARSAYCLSPTVIPVYLRLIRGLLFIRSNTMPTKTKTSTKRAAKKARTSNGSRLLGQLKEPKSPMPKQHQEKPGLESKVKPRPRYEAPFYRGSGKLKDKVALITGGDSGIGRAVAVLFAREGADIAITYLPEEKSDAKESKQAIEAEGQNAIMIEGDVRES